MFGKSLAQSEYFPLVTVAVFLTNMALMAVEDGASCGVWA